MKQRSRFRNAIEYWGARAAIASLEWTPLPLAERLAAMYVKLLDASIPRLRRAAMRNLELAFPNKSAGERRRIADGVFNSLARVLLSFARFPCIHKDNVADWIRYEGFENFEVALQRGHGVLFAAAHLGNWELSAFAHGLMTAPMRVITRPLDNPRIEKFVADRRALSGNQIIGKRDFARTIWKALNANEAVGILIDQNSAAGEGIFVNFFGIPACTGTGFAKLAARSGAAVIPGFALWSEAERRYVLRFYPQVKMSGNVEEDTQQLQSVLESVIREYPEQWLWIHRRWKTRPTGTPPIY